jgi:glycosyltransferase involved in cell wall biosynthesis
MNIGFLSINNPYSRDSFSTTTYYSYSALLRLPNAHISVLGHRYHSQEKIRRPLLKILSKVSRDSPDVSAWVQEKSIKACLNDVQRDLRELSIDVVVALVSSRLLSELDPKDYPPFIFVTDATPEFLRETYKWEITPEEYQHEYRAIQKSFKVVYSSDFMADRAQVEYADILSENREKVCAVPFGLNIDSVPAQISERAVDGQLQLLFVGRDWDRKGGDIALEALQQLQARNINAHLTIVGCDPAISAEQPDITIIPYLDKNDPKQQQQYLDILNRSHFLLLPTRADATPMVIAEANAFGIPALVSDVGGIGTLVKPGLNGYLFSAMTSGAQYGDLAAEVFADRDAYQQLSKMSRREYETRLNWDAWAQKMYQLSQEALQDRLAKPNGNRPPF